MSITQIARCFWMYWCIFHHSGIVISPTWQHPSLVMKPCQSPFAEEPSFSSNCLIIKPYILTYFHQTPSRSTPLFIEIKFWFPCNLHILCAYCYLGANSLVRLWTYLLRATDLSSAYAGTIRLKNDWNSLRLKRNKMSLDKGDGLENIKETS